jgi:chloride channel 3/4/5
LLDAVIERFQLDESDVDLDRKCTFSENRLRVPADERVDLESTLEDSVIQLRKEVSQELVVNMFQKLASFFGFLGRCFHS